MKGTIAILVTINEKISSPKKSASDPITAYCSGRYSRSSTASRKRAFDFFNRGAERTQFLVDVRVASFDLLGAVHRRFLWSAECRDENDRSGAQVVGRELATVELGGAGDTNGAN